MTAYTVQVNVSGGNSLVGNIVPTPPGGNGGAFTPWEVSPGDTINFTNGTGNLFTGSQDSISVTVPAGFFTSPSTSQSLSIKTSSTGALTVSSGSGGNFSFQYNATDVFGTDSEKYAGFNSFTKVTSLTGTLKFGTSTAGGTDTLATEEPDGNITVAANISTTGTYHWDLERVNTSIGSANRFGFSGPTSSNAGQIGYPTDGFSATANTDTTFTVGGPVADVNKIHLGYQGVDFTVDLFTAASRGGTKLDTINWSIYDNQSGISNIGVSNTISPVTGAVLIPLEDSTFNASWRQTHRTAADGIVTSQCSALSIRVRNTTNSTTAGSTTIPVATYTGTTQPFTQTLSSTSPSTTGSAETFQPEIFNGQEWLSNGTFTLNFLPAANTQVASQSIAFTQSGNLTVNITNSATTANAEEYSITTTDYGAGGTSGFNTTITSNRINNTLITSAFANSTSSGTAQFGIPSASLPQTPGSVTYYVYAQRKSTFSGEAIYHKRDSFSITRNNETINAPVSNNVTLDNPFDPNYTATFNLTNAGSGGTYQYAIEQGDPTPDNWVAMPSDTATSVTATFARVASPGIIYAQARRSVTDTSGIVNVAGLGFISPDITGLSVSKSPSGTIAFDYTGNVIVTVNGGSAPSRYRVLRTSISNLGCGNTGNLTGAQTSGTITVGDDVDDEELPPTDTTYNYTIQARVDTTNGGTQAWTNTGTNFSITRGPDTTPTYSISAPTSINEGANGTVNVTTTNVANSTTLYWDVDQSTDYATSQGTVTINSNAGSFTLSPTADSATEGAETDTVRLYTDASRTVEVANDSFTINDTSTGGGGSGGGSDGTSTYGLNVYGPDGSTIVFSSNLRSTNALVLASPTIAAGNSVSYTGIADATDASKIAVVINDTASASLFEQNTYTITRSTASGGTIQITNDLSTSRTPSISIYRIA